MTGPKPLPRLDADSEAQAVRDAIWSLGYTAERIAAREGCADIYDVWTAGHRDNPSRPIDDAVDALIRLFLDIKPVPPEVIRAQLGDTLRDGLVSLNLMRLSDDGYRATALLYPSAAVLVASDIPMLKGDPPFADAVYPAITPNTRSFLRALPSTPCGRFLELCAGTGVAALQAAPRAAHAWATDLTERSTHFARFNAMLNGLPNVTALSGDLYEPVAGATFDRIAVHPPYVASAERVMIYRDGGEDGESVTRRVIEGVPAYLAPGGVCYCTCVATDRAGAPLEARLREWLGPSSGDLDVMVAVLSAWRPTERFAQLVAQGSMAAEEAERVLQGFERLGVERQVYASIAIRRHRGRYAPITARRQLGKPEDPSAIARMIQFQSELAEEDALPGVLAMRPRMAAGTTRHTIDQLVEGAWRPSVRQLVREHPFLVRADYDPAVEAFLTRVDGVLTVRDLWEALQRDGAIPDSVEMAAFATIIRWLAASGIIDTTLDAAFA